MNTKIKICGITNLADAQLAIQLGADLLGFNFFTGSARYLDPDTAAEIIRQLPEPIVNVGVFVNEGCDRIVDIVQRCQLDYAQLHGDEDNNFCQKLQRQGVKIIKALRISQPGDLDKLAQFDGVEAFLLDTFTAGEYGGTGRQFNWQWLKNRNLSKIYLAGGIGPDNIRAALLVGVAGVDICSSVESSPGKKDVDKMKCLFGRMR